jgi:hypothetical protein
MNSTKCLRARTRATLFCLAILGLSGLIAQPLQAGIFTLVDDNSAVDFDTANSGNAVNWRVDGQDQLFQQAFWYRIGNVAESSVHGLPILTEGTTDTNFDGDHENLYVQYGGAGFNIEINYSLDGGAPGSGASDMGEQISINNTSDSPLNFHFFQYADFDLVASIGNDTAVFTNANTVRQSEGLQRLTETVATPVPSHRELDFFANTLGRLNDLVPTTLSDTPGTGVPFGPGDVTWAFQWDITIAPRSTFQISKDKNLSAIPEPASIGLLCMAVGLLAMRRRRS